MKIRKERGITLIALVITIIVLLILAATSIAMLTGENGIISQAQNAKNNSKKAEIEEKIKLAVIASKINEEGTIDLSRLDTELKGAGITNIEKNGPEGGLPWIVEEGGVKYEITEEGEVIEKKENEKGGITLNKSQLKLLKGKSERLIATKKQGTSGDIEWSSSNTTVATVDNQGNVTAKGNVGDTAKITVKIGNYSDECEVIIVSEVTGISADPIEVSVGETKEIVVKTTPAQNVEDMTYSYSSGDTSKVTVNTKGNVKGVETTTSPVNVTITGTNSEGETFAGTCQVTVKVNIKENPSAEDIAKNPEIYYGKIVKNYTTGDATYRIFFVDKENKYGDGINTIYLKADYTSNKTTSLNTSYVTSKTKVKEMNPDWAKNRRNNESGWDTNEKAAAWLCDPEDGSDIGRPWSNNYDGSKANYVIGSPSVEMFIDSYNSVPHTSVGNNVLGAKYRATKAPGYVYTVNNGSEVYLTSPDTVDYEGYGNMYCGLNGQKGDVWNW
ncbi:MAG: hypothetical protein HFJ55_05800 [Clostridia bacterium]|nr:hypothetical protein [Clostridia bacterium]